MRKRRVKPLILWLFVCVFVDSPAYAKGKKTPEVDFVKNQTVDREVKQGIGRAKDAVNALAEKQSQQMNGWIRQEGKGYYDYYKQMLDRGPDKPESKAARGKADRESSELWKDKAQILKKNWDKLKDENAKRSKQTLYSLERQGIKSLSRPAPEKKVRRTSWGGVKTAKPGSFFMDSGEKDPSASPESAEPSLDGSDIPKTMEFP